MKKKLEEESPKTVLILNWSFKHVVLPILFGLGIAHLLTAYLGVPQMWGIHFLHFFPAWRGWLLTLVTLSLFIPPINSFVLKTFESLLSFMNAHLAIKSKRRRYSVYLMVSIFSIPLFWVLRTKLYLLGDGYFKINALTRGEIVPTEWLDGVVHVWFYKLYSGISPGLDPFLSYSILSILGGGIFVFLILCLSHVLGKTNFQKVLIFCILFSVGSIELFFGYVESYPLLLVTLTSFILFSILYLQAKTSIIFSFISLVLSIGFHVSATAFVPAFFYLIFAKYRDERKGYSRVLTLLSLIGCFLLILYVIWKVFFLKGEGGGFSRFIPLFPSSKTSFTLFSGAHLLEFMNQWLLISPVGILLFCVFLLFTFKYKDFRNPILNFFLLSSLFSLIFVFIYNSKLGSADWDLRSFPGVFFTLLGVLFFVEMGRSWSRFKNYGLILITISFFHTIPWILVNANNQSSVDRYVLIRMNDPHPEIADQQKSSLWKVGRILEMAGLYKEAAEVLHEGIKSAPLDLGNYSYLGQNYYLAGDYDRAVFFLEKALELEPRSPTIRFILGKAYLQKMDYPNATLHLEKLINTYDHEPQFVSYLALAYLKSHRDVEAKTILEEAVSKYPESPVLHGLLGTSLFSLGDFANAEKEWAIALKLFPKDAYAKNGLAELRNITGK